MKNKILSLFLSALFAVAFVCLPLAALSADVPAKAAAGSKAVFTVTVEGTAPFAYVWYKAAPGSTAFEAIPGQTGATYTIESVTPADAGQYRVEVTNDYGRTTSTIASVSTGTAPNVVSFGVVVTPPGAGNGGAP